LILSGSRRDSLPGKLLVILRLAHPPGPSLKVLADPLPRPLAGKAYFTTLYTLGQYLLTDYMPRKTKQIH